MMPWLVRLLARMTVVLLCMLVVECVSFLLFREFGWPRLYWYPVSYGMVALAGYDVVKRLPLVWGAAIGALLAGAASLCSWPIGSLVLDHEFRYPPEADPLIVATAVLLAGIVGAIVAVVAGTVARDRRRHRSRRSAMNKLAYSAFDEPLDPVDDLLKPIAMPMAERAERRESR